MRVAQIVLDAGRLGERHTGTWRRADGAAVEFAPPRELLARKDGVFRALVEQSVDRDELVAMANGEGGSK